MKTFRNWLNKKPQLASAVSTEPPPSSISLFEDNTPVRFSVFRAHGGLVVQTHQYDARKGENISNLHIVNSHENLGECLNKIMTIEMLRLP